MKNFSSYTENNYKLKSLISKYGCFGYVEKYFLIKENSIQKIGEIEFRIKNNLIEVFFIQTIFSQNGRIKGAGKEILLNFIRKYKNLGYKKIVIKEIFPENINFFKKTLNKIKYYLKGNDIHIYFS